MQPLIGGPRAHLTEQVVLDALSLNHGARILWGVDVLDATDTVTADVLPVVSGSITWSYRPPAGTAGRTTATAQVRRRADLVVMGAVHAEVLVARRFRPWVELQASTGELVRFHQGVFIATNPGASDDGTVVTRQVKLADKTYRWGQRTLAEPLHIPAGTNLVGWVQGRLSTVFGEPLTEITASAVVSDEARVFGTGTAELDVMNALLEAAGYDALTATEEGRPRSVPLATLAAMSPERTYGPGQGKVVTAASVEPLLPTLPNVVRFVARQGPSLPELGNGITERRNEWTGPAAINARGEEVQELVTVEAENQAELEAVADAECQRFFAGGGDRVQIQVGYNPAMSDRDVIGLDKPRLDLAGVWLVTSWSLPLGPVASDADVLMPITCERRVAWS